MEIRDFAESILFSPSLDAKLRPPGQLSDRQPGPSVRTPVEPHRPQALRFTTRRTKFKLPSTNELESDPVRGRLLHFFANHELLATELMALALLKFPDAPGEFRAGLVKTLQDEQAHTKMYLGRLRQLGVEFGEFPVNGFFWRVIADMATPLDYVSRLALTFEQANLDYSRFFSDRFRVVGDVPSEKLMDRIYRDEIGHVGFGLDWFRHWKNPARTDWEAFESILNLPLSPNRAKAEPFNRAGRRAAGFDPDFIDRLQVYSRSKGRPPHVYHFNPFAEAFVGRGGSFAPNKRQAALAHDLEILPAYLCRKDDIVLVNELPNTAFLSRLKKAGIDLPEFELLRDGAIVRDSDLHVRKLAGLRPWAWSPDSIALFGGLGDSPKVPAPTPAKWEHGHRPLYSKATAIELLRELLADFKDTDFLCLEADVGRAAHSSAEALTLIDDWRQIGRGRLVAKRYHGVAGTNMCRLWEPVTSDAQRVWLERACAEDGGVVIEPWLDRVLDFSFQFDFNRGKLRLPGMPRMVNDPRGQYLASEYHPRFATGLPSELVGFLNGPRGGRLKRLHAEVGDLLLPRLRDAAYQGALGIDALVYRDGDRLRLKPVVEINPRFTMGRLMLELMRYATNGSNGRFELVTPATLRRGGWPSFVAYAANLDRDFPIRLTGSPKPRIESGAVCLNDPVTARGCLAVFRIEARV